MRKARSQTGDREADPRIGDRRGDRQVIETKANANGMFAFRMLDCVGERLAHRREEMFEIRFRYAATAGMR